MADGLRKVWAVSAAPPDAYPPIKSIPRTSNQRLEQSAPGYGGHVDASTVLYLAYGSNLCAETFLGRRGIRPVSQINVSAPSLSLTFDLPGVPYTEPCVANTAPRKIPKQPIPDPINPAPLPPPIEKPPSSKPEWDKGLIGVVYEVTKEDFAHIILTEGGGGSYHDILVPCLIIPPRMSVPEKPALPDIPKPFLAHTLYAPQIPDGPSDDPKDPKNPDPRKKWWWRFAMKPRRPDPDYAQPSLRYMTLIRNGAAEHDLPDDYQAYLAAIETYTITTRRQTIGRYLMTLLLAPLYRVIWPLYPKLGNEAGSLPAWLSIVLAVYFNLIWMSYDAVLRPILGDGERTEEKTERAGITRWASTDGQLWADEKARLISEV